MSHVESVAKKIDDLLIIMKKKYKINKGKNTKFGMQFTQSSRKLQPIPSLYNEQMHERCRQFHDVTGGAP